ncbi:hypothetical protein KY285_033649 [Solanum tuberosum]|nr:hypothetical protein KY285_033649 [Solanum tuberosum]
MEVVVLDRFNGNTDPEDWISRAERYFNFLGFSEEHWLPLPSFYLDGEALEWFRWMFRNKQFFDWTHFKEKLALRFPKRTYAKSPVVDAQISNILALLQKIENKYSVTSKQVLVENAGISAATVLSREISLAEENSSCVDNVESHLELFGTSIVEHSSHVDNMFDEMSTGVFTKEIQETSSASSFVADLDDIQSPRVFDECFPSCCPMIVAEVQPDTPNDMLDEESPGPKHNEAQLFDDCSPKDMSKSIAQSNRPLDELMLVVEHGKFTCEFSTHNILSQFSLVPDADIFLITVPVIAIDICVWDPGICLEFLALTDFTENIEELLLLGCTGKFFFKADSNSMSRVWDPGQTWCVHCYLSNGFCVMYNYIAFTCPSIAYELVIDEFFDVNHDILVANFDQPSVWRHNIRIDLDMEQVESNLKFVPLKDNREFLHYNSFRSLVYFVGSSTRIVHLDKWFSGQMLTDNVPRQNNMLWLGNYGLKEGKYVALTMFQNLV